MGSPLPALPDAAGAADWRGPPCPAALTCAELARILASVSLQVTTVSSHPLDSFERQERRAALLRHAAAAPPPVRPNDRAPVNMHLHTFFSFNAAGFSPSHLAVQAREWGLYTAATCDFDVLDAADEFLEAASLLGLRGASHIETRVYAPEFAEVETNSPGEPGICYVMGAGFSQTPQPGGDSFPMAEQLRQRAAGRNAAIVERLNAHLPEIAVSYESEVASLTPRHSPTERHIVRAYVNRARQVFPDSTAQAAFWGDVLQQPAVAVAALSRGRLEEQVRRCLIKRGGVAYQQPGPASFPEIGSFFAWVRDAGAMPMAAWRDGTSAGESDPDAWLEALEARGVAAVNVVPELVTDPVRLQRVMAEVVRRALPANVGTEMNADGLPDWDDLQSPELAPWRDAFVTGAEVIVGHTTLARYAGFPYCGAAAEAEFPRRDRRNAFFAAVGRLPPPAPAAARRLAEIGETAALECVRDAVRHGDWVHG